jgi:hypothetical protein
MTAVALKVVESRLGIRDSFTRMPFRFGVVTMTAAAQATIAVTIEDAGGRRATGWAADMLAYRWFDKRPEKTLADNVADPIAAIGIADALYREQPFQSPFAHWRATHDEIERRCLAAGHNRLISCFGSSMLERGVIDALGRLTGRSYFDLVRDNALGIELGATFPELKGRSVAEFLPGRPADRVNLRHTVGLVDPITAADVPPAERLNDGLPQTLEDYLDHDGIACLKLKVGGNLGADIARLETIAGAMRTRPRAWAASLDGNEQYKKLDDFMGLIEALKSRPALKPVADAILFIEQPLDRAGALAPEVAPALATLSRDWPVIIDESDGWVSAFREAIELGYRGTSHKNCKGIYKSLHNLAFARVLGARDPARPLFLSAEDLTVLPVVGLQADLASVALLGIDHVERNGHHYFRGLGHLSAAEKDAALARHPDLYARRGDEAFLEIRSGQLAIGSLQCPGMGFAVPPDMDAMTPAADWRFERLGLG